MSMKTHTRIDLAEGGNIFKQGDHVSLGFTPRDYAGNVEVLTGKDISVVIWSRKGIMYEGEATFDSEAQLIRLEIEETLQHGDFNIEFTVTDSTDAGYRKKFPSGDYDGKISIKPSADNIDVVGVQMTTVSQLRQEQKSAQQTFEANVLPRVETVETTAAELSQRVEDGIGAFTEDTEVLDARMGEVNLREFNRKTTEKLAEKVGGQVKLKPEEFSDEAMALVTGNGTVNVLSVPQSGSVSYEKLNPLLKDSVKGLVYSKELYGTHTAYTPGTAAATALGYAVGIAYKGQNFTAVKIYVNAETFNGNFIATVRKSSDISVIVSTSNPIKVTSADYYTFVFSKKITALDLSNEDSFFVTLESVEKVDKIKPPSEATGAPVTANVIPLSFRQLSSSGAWAVLNSNTRFALNVTLLGDIDINAELENVVRNDIEYQQLKDSTDSLQATNEVYNTHFKIPVLGTSDAFRGWSTPIYYDGKDVISAKIFLNMATFNGAVISTLRKKSDFSVIATSQPVSPSQKGLYTFVFDKKVTSDIYTESEIYVAIESLGRVDTIYSTGAEGTITTGQVSGISKYMNSAGSWYDGTTTSRFTLYVILCNSNTAEAIANKIDKPKDEEVEIMRFPKTFYTVSNDVDWSSSKERHHSLPIYSEFLANRFHNLTFQNGIDRFTLPSRKTTANTEVVANNIRFNSQKVDSVSVNQVLTKASVPNKKSFVLSIGDSLTAGTGSQNRQYWKVAAELFEKESIDFGRENTVKFVGVVEKREPSTIDYKGVNKTIYSSADGRSGWSGLDYLRYSNVKVMDQKTWDELGLGNGSGTDFTGSDAQKTLIRNTNEVNPAISTANAFFDNDKPGTNRFSIEKWLERYRTLDDQGNRLELGSGTGSLITADNLETIDVCTPTHIVLKFGHNDFSRHTPELFFDYMREWVDTIRAELPDAYVIISLSPPRLGLWNPDRYPNYIGTSAPINLDRYIANAENWITHFNTFDEKANKVFLLPDFHTTPSADGYESIEQIDGAGNRFHTVSGDTIHAGYKAHAIWGYQLYSLLKYTMTL